MLTFVFTLKWRILLFAVTENLNFFQRRIKALEFLSSFNLVSSPDDEATALEVSAAVLKNLVPSAQLYFLVEAHGLGVCAEDAIDHGMMNWKVSIYCYSQDKCASKMFFAVLNCIYWSIEASIA